VLVPQRPGMGAYDTNTPIPTMVLPQVVEGW
jgi:hypothetical protein